MADLLMGLGWAADASGRYGPVLTLLARGTVLLLVVFGLALALRRGSPGLRHLVWSGGLVALLLLPAVGSSLPPLRVLPWRAAAVATPTTAAPAIPTGSATAAPLVRVPSASPSGAHDPASVPPAASCSNCGRSSPSAPARSRVPAAYWLLAAWAGGLVLLVGRMLYGWLALSRIVGGGEPLEGPEWRHPLYDAADILGLDDAPRLVMSDAVQLPFTAGMLHPVVVVPRAAESWSEDRRRAVLSHELAHVRRRDLVAHLLGRLTCALYWFHPLVWLAAKAARDEGERACDDLVLTTGARASAYADHLLQIVCAAARTTAPVVAIPMAQRTSFEGRMLAILEPAARHKGPGRLQVLGTVGGLALLLVAVAAAAPGAPVAQEASQPPAGQVASGNRSRGIKPPGSGSEKVSPTAFAFPDTEKPGRSDKRDGSLSDVIGSTVTRTLTSMNLSQNIQVSTAQTFDGGGMITPTPMPMPMPVVMRFDGRRSGPPHRAQPHRSRKSGDPKVVAALINALADDQADVRAHAAYALGELGDPKAIPALAGRLRTDGEPEARRMAAWALSEIEDDQGAPPLGEAVRSDANQGVRLMAAYALGNMDCGGQESVLGEALVRDADADVRASAAWALGQCSAEPAAPSLTRALGDASPRVRSTAAWALGELEVTSAPAALSAALRDSDVEMRRTAAWALGQIGDEHSSPALAAALKDPDAQVRRTALWALGQAGGEAARDALLEAIKSGDPIIRRYAAQALAEIR